MEGARGGDLDRALRRARKVRQAPFGGFLWLSGVAFKRLSFWLILCKRQQNMRKGAVEYHDVVCFGLWGFGVTEF